MHKGKILLVDDDDKSREFLSSFLHYKGYEVMQAQDAVEALAIIDNEEISLVLTDLMMPKLNGLELVRKLKESRPETVVIVYSAFNSYEMTTNLMKAGAYICLDKPLNLEEFETHVNRAMEHYAMQHRAFKGKPAVRNRMLLSNIVGKSDKILSLLELVEKVAESDATVLIQGESGTGKELFARAIHDLSNRKNRNFVPVNCAAIPDDLLESELFGHVKGSFTGAVANRIGRFEFADKGTLFLDEIGDMKLMLQAKLLRVLQSREVEPVGGLQTKKIDTRFIAATNQNLEQLVEDRAFREDLFYRLSVIPMFIPPLRERKEDIPLLIESFVNRNRGDKRGKGLIFDRTALEVLCHYPWPGNIRELENLIERLTIMKGGGLITVDDLPGKYRVRVVPAVTEPEEYSIPSTGVSFNDVMEEFENKLINAALLKSGGNKKEAAEFLQLKRTTFIEKLRKKNMFPGYSPAAA